MAHKPFNSYLLVAILVPLGLLIFVSVLTYDYARTWTDVSAGLLNGLFHSVLYSIGYLIVFVPLICLGIFLTRKRPRAFLLRSALCLLPLLAVCACSVISWISNPITHRNCFESTMGFAMPASASSILAERTGGGITEVSDTYYFTADANEIRKMLSQKPFKLTSEDPFETPTGWPKSKAWIGVKTYQYDADDRWYYSIQTNHDSTQAIVSACCI